MATEVRFTIDEEYIKNLQKKLKGAKPTDIAREALTILNWAVDEAAKGRVILSTSRDGGDIHRLAMPALSRVAKDDEDALAGEGRRAEAA